MVDNGIVGSHMAGGFHIMTPQGKEGKKTAQHTNEFKDAVWKHTCQELDTALRS
jgi:hypothetical protein